VLGGDAKHRNIDREGEKDGGNDSLGHINKERQREDACRLDVSVVK